LHWHHKARLLFPSPFFSISQANSVGVQLADFVTAIIGLRFSGIHSVQPFFDSLQNSIYRYKNNDGSWNSGLKVMRAKKEKAPGGP
jgi:hypothetical protein